MDSQHIAYWFWSWIAWVIGHVYFREIIVDGLHNIPTHGAVMFVGNHQNQFMDPLLIVSTAPRTVGFLIASKSMNGIVGFFAKQFLAIPVKRSQDLAVKGSGLISIEADSTEVIGIGTRFTKEFELRDSICIAKEVYAIAKIESDEKLIIQSAIKKKIEKDKYQKHPHVNQNEVYTEVWNRLGNADCVGIFPEGGSHDRTQLLPIKAGVAQMVLGAMAKHNIPVNIVPVGLNYYVSGHRFRGSVLVEYGRPYKIPMEYGAMYNTDKRKAFGHVLSTVEDLMNSVVLTAPDLETLQVLHLARKLYQPNNVTLTTKKYLNLSHQLTKGFTESASKPRVSQLYEEISSYKTKLDNIGLKDRHIASSNGIDLRAALYMLLKFLFTTLLLLFSLPFVLLNLPIGIYARKSAAEHAKFALQNSTVKVSGKDVMSSKKLTIAMVLMPPMYFLYSMVVAWLWGAGTAAVFFVCLPFFSFASVRVAEEGISLFGSMKAFVTMKWIGTEIQNLIQTRNYLQERIRTVVKEEFGFVVDDFSNKETGKSLLSHAVNVVPEDPFDNIMEEMDDVDELLH